MSDDFSTAVGLIFGLLIIAAAFVLLAVRIRMVAKARRERADLIDSSSAEDLARNYTRESLSSLYDGAAERMKATADSPALSREWTNRMSKVGDALDMQQSGDL